MVQHFNNDHPPTDYWPTFLICRHIFCGWVESCAGDMWEVDSTLCSVPRKIFQLWVRQNGNWETLGWYWVVRREEAQTSRNKNTKVTRKVALLIGGPIVKESNLCMCKNLAVLIKMLFHIFLSRIAPGPWHCYRTNFLLPSSALVW